MAGHRAADGLLSRGFAFFISTQFLGAFNDNAFKFLIIGFAMSRLTPDASRNYIPLASSLFIVPFLLFSSYAGYLSDRFTKRQVMIWTKVMEVAVMLAGFVLFYHQATYWLLVVLFLMGAQSTFFSPAKYAYLPETLQEKKLSAGNGLLQLFTFLAIIFGGGIGSHLAERYSANIHYGAVFCVIVAVVGLLTSFGIGRTRPGNPDAPRCYDPIRPHLRTLGQLFRDPLLMFSILGCTFFWCAATVIQSNIPIIVRQDIGAGDSAMGYLQAALALGIGIGSALAGVLSFGKIAYWFVIPSGCLMAGFLIISGLSASSLSMALMTCSLVGTAGGFYQIPLTAGIQQRSPEAIRGASLAACNALDCISMLIGTALHWLLLKPLGLSGGGVLIALGCLTFSYMLFLIFLKRRSCISPSVAGNDRAEQE